MRRLFYDTETTGFPDWHQPSGAPQQPHIVQLGAVLLDMDSGRRLATLDVIIRPDGWTIPAEASEIHGITTEIALAVGVPEDLAVELLLDLNARCSERVAHNESFDQRIVRIACKRFFGDASAEEWRATPTRCTMVMATPIMRLPPTEKMRRAGRGGQFKQPRLSEAVQFFCGRELVGAHSAIVDVEGCIDVFAGIQHFQQQEAATA